MTSTELPKRADVVVVGAGLAGLAAAGDLTAAGLDVCVLEAADAVGGRIRTDIVDGFTIDRGFQVLNTGYPQVRRRLDLDALDLRSFTRGALLHIDGARHRLADPRREPGAVPALLRAPVGSAKDKVILGSWLAYCAFAPTRWILREHDEPVLSALTEGGLRTSVVRRLLQPFLRGVLLEDELVTSSRFVELMMRMFVRGATTVPAAGMEQVPRALARSLHPDAVHLATSVTAVRPDGVSVGRRHVAARAVLVAVDATTAVGFTPSATAPPWHGVTTIYHAASQPPIDEPILLLDADEHLVANTVVLTSAAPEYSPDERALVATSVLGGDASDVIGLDQRVRRRLHVLYDTDTSSWSTVAVRAVPQALPAMTAPHDFAKPVRVDGVYVCGDHRDTSSIQGALQSGTRAGRALLDDLRG